ncbi:MAG TPA: VRR-NUC domain-containing protein [Nitrosopumilaceae archaeon]|nr:VRR-NUC domain-containing protein [Nitrosopumilaceae archaeon]
MARQRIEFSHQEAFFQWIKHYPLLDAMTWHTPNGGKRDKFVAIMLKRQGVKRGVPDIFIAIPLHEYHGYFIELKGPDGRLTDSQQTMHQNLKENGYKVDVFNNWFDARTSILEYIKGSLYDKLLAI